jgi:hypothetical protein
VERTGSRTTALTNFPRLVCTSVGLRKEPSARDNAEGPNTHARVAQRPPPLKLCFGIPEGRCSANQQPMFPPLRPCSGKRTRTHDRP